jgi:hypothetical protein
MVRPGVRARRGGGSSARVVFGAVAPEEVGTPLRRVRTERAACAWRRSALSAMRAGRPGPRAWRSARPGAWRRRPPGAGGVRVAVLADGLVRSAARAGRVPWACARCCITSCLCKQMWSGNRTRDTSVNSAVLYPTELSSGDEPDSNRHAVVPHRPYPSAIVMAGPVRDAEANATAVPHVPGGVWSPHRIDVRFLAPFLPPVARRQIFRIFRSVSCPCERPKQNAPGAEPEGVRESSGDRGDRSPVRGDQSGMTPSCAQRQFAGAHASAPKLSGFGSRRSAMCGIRSVIGVFDYSFAVSGEGCARYAFALRCQ